MPNRQETNGKAVRDEIKLLMASLLLGETGFETIAIHPGGFETSSSEAITTTRFNLKHTEQKYLIAKFMKHSRFQWIVHTSHQEGDRFHFGKKYNLTKVSG